MFFLCLPPLVHSRALASRNFYVLQHFVINGFYSQAFSCLNQHGNGLFPCCPKALSLFFRHGLLPSWAKETVLHLFAHVFFVCGFFFSSFFSYPARWQAPVLPEGPLRARSGRNFLREHSGCTGGSTAFLHSVLSAADGRRSRAVFCVPLVRPLLPFSRVRSCAFFCLRARDDKESWFFFFSLPCHMMVSQRFASRRLQGERVFACTQISSPFPFFSPCMDRRIFTAQSLKIFSRFCSAGSVSPG